MKEKKHVVERKILKKYGESAEVDFLDNDMQWWYTSEPNDSETNDT